MVPLKNTHGSSHPVTVRAYDANGRLVETATYGLDLTASSEPEPENVVLEQWESDTEPSEAGEETAYATLWPIGASGCVRDAHPHVGDPIVGYICSVTSRVSSNRLSSLFVLTHSGPAYYTHTRYTGYSDEIWKMNPMVGHADGYNYQTKNNTSRANTTQTVNFELLLEETPP